MSDTRNLKQRLQELTSLKDTLKQVMKDAAEEATIAAITKTTEETPPKAGEVRGANAVTGDLRQHWAVDSTSTPKEDGNAFVTYLRNNMNYASFVNNGHRLDRHFVPGLYIENGLIAKDLDGNGGLVVGTKTKYIPGVFMAEKGIKKYEQTLEETLNKRIKGVLDK